jgi:hypothetical protein
MTPDPKPAASKPPFTPSPEAIARASNINLRPGDEQTTTMTIGHLRWMLRWHGDFVRELTLLEIRLKERRRRRRRRSRAKRR